MRTEEGDFARDLQPEAAHERAGPCAGGDRLVRAPVATAVPSLLAARYEAATSSLLGGLKRGLRLAWSAALALSAIVGVGLWLEHAPFKAALTRPRLSREGSRATVAEPQQASLSSAEAKVRLQKMGRMPLYFIENRGQRTPDPQRPTAPRSRSRPRSTAREGAFSTRMRPS